MHYIRRGFIELRTIIALLITITMLPLATYIITFASNLDFSYDEINDEISLLELRKILLIAYDVRNDGGNLNFIYDDTNYSLSLINNRMVLQPGYQMFLDKIDDLEFINEGNSIYVKYNKNNKEYKTPIIKQKGIYLDDFSFDDDECDEFTNFDE